MTDIKVALATKKDITQLITYFKHYQIEGIVKKRVNCYTSHNYTVIVKDKGIIVGFLQWSVKEDPKAGVIEFEEMYVTEEYRGKGIGSMLIKFAIQSIKIYFNKIKIRPRKIFLFVNKENKVARALYEKKGFKFVSEIGNLFSDKETELFYLRDL